MIEKKIDTDIEGIIQELNLSESEVLYPLFEATVNSIQSIHERCNENILEPQKKAIGEGEISIYIERDKDEPSIFDDEGNYPIKNIHIVDNGIGFNKSNYDSFFKSHSTKKKAIGGKGVGRFTMLSVFDKMEINSVYKDINNAYYKRRIILSRKDGVMEESPVLIDSKQEKTEISLYDINKKFKNVSGKYNLEQVADSILEHCLLYYLNNAAPTVKIYEDDVHINLTNQFNPFDFVIHTHKDKILDHDFICYYIKNEKLKTHEYLLCGHNRKVKSKRIDKIFPVFSSAISDENGQFWIQGYVVSDYLNKIVNMSRNEINFPKQKIDSDKDDKNTFSFNNDVRTEIVEKDIDSFVIAGILEKFDSLIKERQDYLREKVDAYISSDEGLEYRILDIDDDFLLNIPDTVDEKKLDDILHEQQYKNSKIIRKKRERLLKKDFSHKKDYQELLNEVVQSSTKEGQLKLAQYVSHRKTIIDLLEKYLGWCDENNNYKEESVLHNLIYVMGGNSENTSYDSHNLWLLDDRLAFHKHIYSDTAVRDHKPKKKQTKSRLETDLAIYDIPSTYGDKTEFGDIATIVIFEFKRPDRNINYEEFSKQMNTQIEAVCEGKIIDKNNAHVVTTENTPIFYYYVCDLNGYNSLKSRAKREGFIETPYNSLIRLINSTYEEILTYQTLLVNSKRRNKAFFKKLGIE